MYDVKQYDPKERSSPPLEARVVDRPGVGKIMIGRGAVNSKGPQVTLLAALHAFKAAGKSLPVNLVLVCEGEEEIGSPHFREIVFRPEVEAALKVIRSRLGRRGPCPRRVLGCRLRESEGGRPGRGRTVVRGTVLRGGLTRPGCGALIPLHRPFTACSRLRRYAARTCPGGVTMPEITAQRPPPTRSPTRPRPTPARGSIRVALIEDDRLACARFATLLDRQPGVKVVATASSEAGLAAVLEAKPQVTLVDAGLGMAEGPLCVKCARQAAPEARLIMVEVPPGLPDVVELIEAGAQGFVLKDAPPNVVAGTIQMVAQGNDVLPAQLTTALWSQLADRAITPSPPTALPAAAPLTKREWRITQLILAGLANKEISRRLGIATHTVKSHVHNILAKLGLHTRLEIAAWVRRA